MLICNAKRLKLDWRSRPADPADFIKIMSISKRILLTSIALYLCLAALGCSSGPVSNTTASNTAGGPIVVGKRGGTLTYRITSPVNTLNYFQAKDEPGALLTLFLINDRLVGLDHREQKYVPLLAESYTVAADGKSIDVVLRDGLKFSDGKPITTADVEFTLKAAYDERTKAPIFRDGLLVGGKPIEVTIADARRMQLIMPDVVPVPENYLENLAVLPKHALDADFQAGKLAESWPITADPAGVVTSGAFMIESVTAGERVVLKRNPHYWKKDEAGNQLPYLDSISLETIQDPNNALTRLNQNTLDIADRIRTTDYASLKTANGAAKAFDVGPGQAADFLWFNMNPAKASGEKLEGTPKYKWFTDKRFRRAIAQAVDRKSISSNTLQGLATPVYGFVPAGNKAWLDPQLKTIEYDLERSRALLKEAGFTAKDNGGKPELFDAEGNRVEFTIIVPAENEPRKLMAAVMQEDLAKLGIAMQIAPLEFAEVTKRWATTFDYDAILSGLSLTATDPSSYATLLQSKAGQHYWRPKQATPATEWEAKIDELYDQQSKERDPAARRQKFNEIQTAMSEEMPIVPIVSRHIVSAANERIGNISPSSILPFSMWNADRLFVR